MFYDAVKNTHGLPHDPFKAIVAPRPIGWISSLSADGVANLAPYSFFNAVSSNPHIVMFSSATWKDSVRNVGETGEFVCSLATLALSEAMNMSSAPVGSQVDEFELAGLKPVASKLVKPARVGESPIALECKHLFTRELTDISGQSANHWVVFGQVIGIHIDDDALTDGMLDLAQIKPLARCGYKDYSVVERLFAMDRPQAPKS